MPWALACLALSVGLKAHHAGPLCWPGQVAKGELQCSPQSDAGTGSVQHGKSALCPLQQQTQNSSVLPYLAYLAQPWYDFDAALMLPP